MRILLLSTELLPEEAGGIATYTDTIAPALAARGHEVHVLSCSPGYQECDTFDRGVSWHRRRPRGETFARLRRYPRSATRLAGAYAYRREIARLGMRFDVVESPEWLAPSLLVGALMRVPLVVNLHTPLRVISWFEQRRDPILDGRIGRFGGDLYVSDGLERLSTRFADMVTSTSALLARTLLGAGWLRHEPQVVHCPIDADAWRCVPPAVNTPPNVLAVGRLEPRKGPEILIRAIELLANDVPDIRLTFVGRIRGRLHGGEPYASRLTRAAKESRVPIEFVPQVERGRLAEHYADARVVAVPSLFESFSIVTLEAMASGRPVVCTSQVGAAEILRGSEAGTEVPPGNPERLADALRPYLLSPTSAAESGRIGREVVSDRCAPNVIAEQREGCYEEAIGSTATGRA